MTRVIPDSFLETDAILRYLTADDFEKAGAMLAYLENVERGGERAAVSPMVIFEVVFTLQSYYKVPRENIRAKVSTIIDLRGLSLDDSDVFVEALDLYCEVSLPFADAFNACYMRSRGLTEIYTYDEDYDRVKGIKRFAP